MQTSNEPIRKEQFYQVNQALIATGGRLMSVRECGDLVRIDYEYDDMDGYADFCERQRLIGMKVSEARRDSRWRVVLRRLHLKSVERFLT